jgi:hypothetical protein
MGFVHGKNVEVIGFGIPLFICTHSVSATVIPSLKQECHYLESKNE